MAKAGKIRPDKRGPVDPASSGELTVPSHLSALPPAEEPAEPAEHPGHDALRGLDSRAPIADPEPRLALPFRIDQEYP